MRTKSNGHERNKIFFLRIQINFKLKMRENFQQFKKKKTRQFTSQRKRSSEFCLNANDQVKISQLEDAISVIALQFSNEKNPTIKEA